MTIPAETIEKALQEATLRLAWYLRVHGGIPAAELTKLQLYGHSLKHDAEGIELLNEANLIRDHLLQTCASSES